MKSLPHPFLVAILLLGGGLMASAQDAADNQVALKLFDALPWHVNLGAEFPGAQGSFEVVDQDGAKVGKLAYDFTGGGLYVNGGSGGGDNSIIPDGYSEFRIRVKSATNQKIVIRLIDTTSQTDQYSLPYTEAGDWQLLRIDLKGTPSMSFGGAKDHVVRLPITQIAVGVEKSSGSATQGEVFFKDGMILK